MSKVNAGQASSTLIPKYIGSDFDKVVAVADNIEQVVIVGDNIEDVGTVADNINYVKEVAEDLHGMPVTMYTGENPPVLNPMPEGVMWYCTTDGRTYVWYTDADSGQWVESAPQSAMKDEATNIFFHSTPSNVNPAYRNATLFSTSAPEAEISVAHNALNTPVVQAQFIREEALWVDVSVKGAQGIVTLMGYSSGNSQLKAEIITWKNGAEGTSLGDSQWVTLPNQPSVVSLPVTLANIDVLDAGDSYVVRLTSQMNAGGSAVSTILVDGNTNSRFGIIFNTNLIGLNDGIRDGVITSAPTENAVYDALQLKADKTEVSDALQLKVGKSQLVQSGNLTSTANWANVPAYSDSELGGLGGPLNAQARALTARSELLLTDVREALRRSYAEAGYNLVDGSFEVGGTLVNANDVLLHEASGKAFSGPAGTVAAGMNPAIGGFVDVSGYKTDRLTSVSSLGIIGDGVTDWSAAIQYAIDTYGSLYFPEGTYICANIQLRSGVQLLAASWATVLKLPDGATTRSINGSLPDSKGRYPANVISTVLNHNGGVYYDNGVRAKMLDNSFYIVDGAEVSGFTIDGNKAGNPVGDVGENASAMGAGVCIFLSRGVKVKNNRIINCRQDGVILGYTLCGGSDECDVSENFFFGNQRTNIALITGQRNKITGNIGGPITGGIDTDKVAAIDLEPNWAGEVCANNIITDNIMLGRVNLVCANPAYMRNNKFHGNLWVGSVGVNPSSDTQGSLFDADTFIADTTRPTPGAWIHKAEPFSPSSPSIKTTPPVRFSKCTAIGFDTLLQNLTQGQHENLVVEGSTIRVKTIGRVVRGYRVDIKNNDITMDGDATSGQSILWTNSLGAAVPHQGCNSFKGNSVRGVSQSRLLDVINDKSYTNSRKTVEIHNNDFDVTGHTTIGSVTGDFDFTKNTITDWKPLGVSSVVKPFSIKGNTLSANASTNMFVNQSAYMNDIVVSGNELTNININVQRPSGVTVNSNEMVDCSISVLHSFTASGVGGNSVSFNRMKNKSKTLVPITATRGDSFATADFWFKDIYKGNIISGYASGISIAVELTSVSEVS